MTQHFNLMFISI